VTDEVLQSITSAQVWIAAPDGMLLVDSVGIIQAANEEANRLFCGGSDKLAGTTIETLVPIEHADSTTFPVHIALSPLAESGLTIASVRDMSEHVAFEERLIESTRRRLLAEDHERIARDLHDTVIQELFALGMTLQATLSQISNPEVARRIDGSVATLDDVIRSIRALIFDIGNTSHESESSLRGKLVRIAANLTPSLGFEPAVSFRGPIDTAVPEEIHDHLVAVIREGLANVARHADATAASVTVTIADHQVTVRVNDDGKGIPESGGRRSGLANLLDRALSVGGLCEVSGDPEGGTLLRWAAPIAAR